MDSDSDDTFLEVHSNLDVTVFDEKLESDKAKVIVSSEAASASVPAAVDASVVSSPPTTTTSTSASQVVSVELLPLATKGSVPSANTASNTTVAASGTEQINVGVEVKEKDSVHKCATRSLLHVAEQALLRALDAHSGISGGNMDNMEGMRFIREADHALGSIVVPSQSRKNEQQKCTSSAESSSTVDPCKKNRDPLDEQDRDEQERESMRATIHQLVWLMNSLIVVFELEKAGWMPWYIKQQQRSLLGQLPEWPVDLNPIELSRQCVAIDSVVLRQLCWLPFFLRAYCEFMPCHVSKKPWPPRSITHQVVQLMAQMKHAAKEQNDPIAKTLLGWSYAFGMGVPKIEDGCCALYDAAAAQGYSLAIYLRIGPVPTILNAFPPFPADDLSYMRLLAERGYARAQCDMAILETSAELKKKWLVKADAQGDIKARFALTKMRLDACCVGTETRIAALTQYVKDGLPEAIEALVQCHYKMADELLALQST